MSDRGQPIPPAADADRGQHVSSPGADLGQDPTPAAGAAVPEVTESAPIEINDAPFSLTAESEPAEAEAESRSKVRTIVLSSLLAVSVAGAGMLGWFAYNVNSQRDTTLSAPPAIGSLKLNSSEDAAATAEYLQGALSAEISMDKTVGGVYSSDDGKNVLFFGGTTLLWSPEKDLDTSFELISDEEGAVTGLHEVEAGELGGVMKCGVTHSDGSDLTVCGWADHGSLALAMFPDQAESAAATLMQEIRKATQTRD